MMNVRIHSSYFIKPDDDNGNLVLSSSLPVQVKPICKTKRFPKEISYRQWIYHSKYIT